VTAKLLPVFSLQSDITQVAAKRGGDQKNKHFYSEEQIKSLDEHHNNTGLSHLPLFLAELGLVAGLFVNGVDPSVFVLDTIQPVGVMKGMQRY